VITIRNGRKLSNAQREQRKAQVARFSVLARLVHGREWATAARGAGFASGRAAAQSFQQSKLWATLRDAATGQPASQTDRNLIAIRKHAARVAVRAIEAQRKAVAGSGAVVCAPIMLPGAIWYASQSVKRPVVATLATGSVAVEYSPVVTSNAIAATVGAIKITRPMGTRRIVRGLTSGAIVHPLTREWSEATEQRAQATAIARSARADLRRIKAQRKALWDSASKGLRSGWLNGHA
jgi:hypothetical protein